MTYTYIPKGVCSLEMRIEVEDNIIKHAEIIRACPGNTLGLAKLVEGRTPQEVIDRLDGIQCKDKGTSCPDQLAQALKEILAQTQNT